MALKTTKFDVAKYLETDEDWAFYLSEALATNDAAYIAHALGVVARAKGMSNVAKQTQLSRENLYRTLSDKGNPELDTVLKIIGAFGLKLSALPAEGKATRPRPPSTPRKAITARKRKAA